MKNIIMSISCIILFIGLTSCSGLTLSTGSYYNDFTAKGEDAKYTLTGKAKVNGTSDILYITPSENTEVTLKGRLSSLSGDVQIVYVTPENEDVVILDTSRSHQKKVKFNTIIGLEEGAGRIEFRGDNITFKYDLAFTDINMEQFDHLSADKEPAAENPSETAADF